jgi:hypothetical protein
MLDSFFFAKHLEKDEKKIVIVHKHWLVGIKEMILPFVSLAASLIFFSGDLSLVFFYMVSAWCVGSAIWVLRSFCDYYLDAWIITDQGVIDLAWMGWFHRQSSKVLYSDVQGVSYEIQGILATIFRYGTISIEKISTGAVISLPYVHQPKRIEAIVLKHMEAYLHSKNMKNAKHVQEVLAEFVSEHLQKKSVETAAPTPSQKAL